MGDFEDKLRGAFDAELDRVPARPGLRQRVISNAVATPRNSRRSRGAWLTPPRLVPVALAAALLVVAGIGIRTAIQTSQPIAQKPTSSPSVLAFGTLPPASLQLPIGFGGGGASQPTVVPYFGPATMTWSGHLPTVPPQAPVYRFTLPTIADEDAFAARIGATLLPPRSSKAPRAYSGPADYTTTIGADPSALEPVFNISRQPGAPAGQPVTWNFAVSPVELNPSPTIAVYIVRYQRLIQVTPTTTAGEVDGQGDPAGIQVSVYSNGRVFQVSGVLRLAEESATYPLRAPSTAIPVALAATPLEGKSQPPSQAVSMTQAILVYTVVLSGAVGYIEPAYLFTGQFPLYGFTYEKRILVPALAPGALRS